MTKKDFSHFKYYVKRLKEMGFRVVGTNIKDGEAYVVLQKQIEEREYYAHLSDYSDYKKDGFPQITLNALRSRHDTKSTDFMYKIGFDADFKENIKTLYSRLGYIINEYPTWRSAFNQLVTDYHELENNAHKRIHKGVSIHET